jgi:hypothetical protein
MLVLASVAVSFFSVRLKAALHILAGMAVGLASGVATGALFGSRELGGKLAWQLMCCGGIWVRFATSDEESPFRTTELILAKHRY